mmetsp:Transcript_763/g.963  ORF Transcript_763/g.963 Transcript_763/m.963 type:complete len:268 (-) Transcript_763:231-1034(-)
MKEITFIVLFYLAIIQVSSHVCKREETLVGGYQYDLSPMENQFYTVAYDNVNIIAAACPVDPSGVLGSECSVDDAVAGMENSCFYLGRHSSNGKYQFIENDNPSLGVKVSYGQGDMCEEYPLQRTQATFLFYCDAHGEYDKKGELLSVLTGTENNLPCEYQFEFYTSGACPLYVGDGQVPIYVWLPILVVILMILYCILGAYTKKRMYGASGVELVPHIDLIRKVRTRLYGRNYPAQYQRDVQMRENTAQQSSLLHEDENVNPTHFT